MDDYGTQDSSNFTDTYTSNSYSYNDRGSAYENDRSNDFSFSKENDSPPTRYQVPLGIDTYRSNNDDFSSRSNAYNENDRSNNFSFLKENDSSLNTNQVQSAYNCNNDDLLKENDSSLPITKQAHTGGDPYHSSNNDDRISDMKQSSNSDSEDLASKNSLENSVSETLENLEDSDLKNINFKVDQNSPITNQDTRSDTFMNGNESEYDNDCCSCKNNPLMCLAFFCDCFGL